MTIEEKYEIGLNILRELFSIPSFDLKIKIKEICGDLIPIDFSFDESNLHKLSIDDVPNKIEIWYYSNIIIDAFGIYYKPEHAAGFQIIEFNKHFKLN